MTPRSIFLVGFMGAGKSTLGSLLAARMARPFIDLDSRIEERAGRSVSKIFADGGEQAFRELEGEALAAVCQDDAGAVVATGGGVVGRQRNIDAMKASGVVIGLSVSMAEVRARIPDAASRPLLADIARARALLARRQSAYRQAHATLDTDGRSVDELVRAAERLAHRMLSSESAASWVALSHAAYPIRVAPGLVSMSPAEAVGDASKVAIISDDNVAPLYLQGLADAIERPVVSHVVNAGERSKSMTQVEAMCDELAPILDRQSLIIALGGGVVGDLAGFVAATLFRGIPVVQMPTTLLAMTDSAIGGKTGVNLSVGKNLVGAFWQPKAVLADPGVLATLPLRERRAAMGELVKYGLLDGEDLMADIEALAEPLCQPAMPSDDGYVELLTRVIVRCAGFKAWVVLLDERERGLRATLNLGHTVGHAIEAHAGYGSILHGEAVGLGMLAACRLAHNTGASISDLEPRVRNVLTRAGLDTDLEPWLSEDVLSRVGVDKKRTGKKVRFIVPIEPGTVEVTPFTSAEIALSLRS